MIARVACSKTLLHQFQVVPRALVVQAQEAAVDPRGARMPEKKRQWRDAGHLLSVVRMMGDTNSSCAHLQSGSRTSFVRAHHQQARGVRQAELADRQAASARVPLPMSPPLPTTCPPSSTRVSLPIRPLRSCATADPARQSAATATINTARFLSLSSNEIACGVPRTGLSDAGRRAVTMDEGRCGVTKANAKLLNVRPTSKPPRHAE